MSNRNLERVRALLARAAHTETPEEEARSSAVIAARLIVKCGFTVVDKSQAALDGVWMADYEPYTPRHSTNVPIDWDNVEPLRLFRVEKARGPAFCFCCKKEVRSPSLICKEINGSRVTCTDPKCKESWSGI